MPWLGTPTGTNRALESYFYWKLRLTYAKVAKGSDKSLSVNKSSGAITVRKGAAKGVHTVKVKVTAAGNASYKSAAKVVIVRIQVK